MIPEADMVALSDVGFEPLVEEVGGAHGHELDQRVALVGREVAETLHHEMELLEIARIESGGIRAGP